MTESGSVAPMEVFVRNRAPPGPTRGTTRKFLRSVFANAVIHSVRPCMDPATEIADLLEAVLLQQFHRFHAARSHLADRDNLLV